MPIALERDPQYLHSVISRKFVEWKASFPAHTVHSNASDNIFTQMLLNSVSHPLAIAHLHFKHTETSNTSVWLSLVVSKALLIGGN